MQCIRIASLSPAATEILFALSKGGDIVCTDQFSNFPEEARALPHLKDHQKIDIDALRSFRPDLVLTGTLVQQKLAEQLRAAECSVVHQDPRSLPEIEQSVRDLAVILDARTQADALLLRFRQTLNDVKKKANVLPKKIKIYCEEWPGSALSSGATPGKHQPPMVSGNWVPELIRVAGGISFPLTPGESSRAVTLEEVQRFAPDLIVISWCGAGSLADPQLLLGRPGWEVLRAVTDRRVRVIDDSLLNRPGPRVVEGAQRLYGWLFEMLH